MKNKTEKFNIALILILVINFIVYKAYHYDNIFQIIIYPILGIIFLYYFYKVIRYNIKTYNETKNKSSFFTAVILIFFIFTIPIIVLHYEKLINKDKILTAQNFGAYLNFYNDNTYIIKSGSWASKTHFYGKYEFKGNSIILDKNGLDDVITSRKFIIIKSKDKYNKTESIKTYLVNVDSNNKMKQTRLVAFDADKNEIYEPMFLEAKFVKK